MDNLILFLNQFFSYIVLFLIIIAVAAVAMAIGINARKANDAKMLAAQGADTKAQDLPEE